MKKFIFSLLIFFTFSCEEVVDIPLDTAPPRLVIEADIMWRKGTTSPNQQVKLTLTTGFYETVIPPANGASVQLIDNNSGQSFTFIEDDLTGVYKCANFEPVLNASYTLQIIYKGETYRATEKLLPTPSILTVEQEIVNGLTGDEIQLTFFFQDNPNEANYYLQKIESNILTRAELFANRDEFFNGNLMFEVFRNEDLKPGSLVKFTLNSITQRDFTFMRQFIALSGSGGGSPFNPPSGVLKGNIKNITNDANFPLGYFRLAETDEKVYVVQ